MRRLTLLCGAVSLTIGLCAGCPRQQPEKPSENVLPFEGIALHVTVVDDPAIAAGISRIASEWRAVTGGTIKVTEKSLADLSDSKPDGDVLIVPPRRFGSLAEAGALTNISDVALEQPGYQWRQVFETLQSHETGWGGKTLAMPLGSPVFTMMYRQDLLTRHDQKPPTTWEEFQQVAELLARESQLPSLEPLASGWSGLMLLARAACYAKHTDNYSALFHAETMEPLIAGPAYERALTELVVVTRLRTAAEFYDPAKVCQQFLEGKATMAITWASAAANLNAQFKRAEGIEYGFVELPGSHEVYDLRRGEWQRHSDRKVRHVPLVAPSGRLACVSKEYEFTEAAIELVRWLSGPNWSADVSARSPATTLFRNSHLKDAKQWCDPSFSRAEAEAYGETVQRALDCPNFLAALRIPGAGKYMAALDRAVEAAVAGEQTPKAALEKAAETWQQITDEIGRDAQRKAYRHSNGLD